MYMYVYVYVICKSYVYYTQRNSSYYHHRPASPEKSQKLRYHPAFPTFLNTLKPISLLKPDLFPFQCLYHIPSQFRHKFSSN